MDHPIIRSLLHCKPSVVAWSLIFAITCGVIFCQAFSAAAEPANGVFGVTITITTDGIFNPTVQSAKIVKVFEGLPAAKAGLAVGDEVLEVDGQRIPGATAHELAPLTKGKKVGESVALVFARPGKGHYTVELVAVTRPPD